VIVGHYLSFAGPEGFRGCCVVKAPDLDSAIHLATMLGINPGGECVGFPFDMTDCPPKYHDRLLSKEDVAAMDLEMGEDGEPVPIEELQRAADAGEIGVRREVDDGQKN
jgi:hypothetical protein